MHHESISYYADILPFYFNVRLAYRDGVVTIGDLATHEAICALVLEEDDRVVVADGGLEQALGVVWSGGGDDLESRGVGEEGLDALRVVERSANAAALGSSEHHRYVHLAISSVAYAGGLTHYLVDRGPYEVGEFNFGDGPHPVHGGADSDGGYGGLGKRGVYDARFAELIEKAVCG